MKKNKHGGSRKGSGRKKGKTFKEATKVMRIPVSKVPQVYDFIKGKTKTIHPMP